MKRPDTWECRSEKEQKYFIAWTVECLDEQLEEGIRRANNVSPERERHLLEHLSNRKLDSAKSQARNGNLVPLQRLYPEIEEFIQKPRAGKGVYRRPPTSDDNTRQAVKWAIRFMRKTLWPLEFGKKNRAKLNKPSAEEIAAAWLGITETHVARLLKPSGKKRVR